MPIRKSCSICGSRFFVKPSRIKQGKGKYCSRPCFETGRLENTDRKYIGKKFGKLTVIDRTAENNQKWLCQCDCGNQAIVNVHAITNGETVSCGCHKREVGKRMAAQNFEGPKLIEPGTRFTRWTVIKGKNVDGRYQYLCECECGERKWVSQANLVAKESQSCGCYHREVAREQGKLNVTHGMSGTAAYRAWQKNMRRDASTDWTLEMEIALRELQPECVICGSIDRLAIDHVIPVTKGGKLEPGNAVVLCKSHNSAKHNRDLSDLPFTWALMIDYAAHSFQDAWLA